MRVPILSSASLHPNFKFVTTPEISGNSKRATHRPSRGGIKIGPPRSALCATINHTERLSAPPPSCSARNGETRPHERAHRIISLPVREILVLFQQCDAIKDNQKTSCGRRERPCVPSPGNRRPVSASTTARRKRPGSRFHCAPFPPNLAPPTSRSRAVKRIPSRSACAFTTRTCTRRTVRVPMRRGKFSILWNGAATRRSGRCGWLASRLTSRP